MTRKEKFIASFKDWKTYVFKIFPSLLLIAGAVIAIVYKSYNTRIMSSLIMLFAALFTISIPQLIDLFKRKTKRTTILAIILLVAVVATVVVLAFCFVDMPKLLKLEEESEALRQEYLQVDPADKELVQQKHDAWRDVKDELFETSSALNEKYYAIFIVWLFVGLIAFFADPKGYGMGTYDKQSQDGDSQANSTQDSAPKNDTTIY